MEGNGIQGGGPRKQKPEHFSLGQRISLMVLVVTWQQTNVSPSSCQSHVSISLLICFVLWQFASLTAASIWQSFEEKAACKGCVCTIWHKQGQQAEKSVMLTGVWALRLTLNYRQIFFFLSTTSWGDNRHSIRSWGSLSSITSQCYILD